jgi:hypothetical protein
MLRRFARKYGTRDIVEEYRSIPVCPLVDGWSVADDEWAEDIGGIPALTGRRSSASQPNVSYFASFEGFFLATSLVNKMLTDRIISPQC